MNRRIDLQTCREQHDSIRILLEVTKLLARLFAILGSHLKLEDNRLYPALERSSDRTIRETALHYRQEMGGLKRAFADFMTTWATESAIAADPEGFMAAWSAVRRALEVRMEKEDHGLYRMAESATL